MKSCFFIGYHDAPEYIKPRLVDAVERHITEYGVTEFVVGQHGAFDLMSAGVLVAVKKKHPTITLFMLIAYHPSDRAPMLYEGFDAAYYPPGMESVPRSVAIVRANRAAVQSSDYLICYDPGYVGNTRNLVEFARRHERRGLLRIENLAEIKK